MLRRLRQLLAMLALTGTTAALGFSSLPQDEDPNELARPFSLPNARLTQELREKTAELIGEGRWQEVLRMLQILLEEHRGKVLDGEFTDAEGRNSQELVYRGASAWAKAQLIANRAELGEPYRERYDKEARKAYDSALAENSRAALVEVARRYPLAKVASSAWWALGDLEFERGSAIDAREAWLRAAQANALLEQANNASQESRLKLLEDWDAERGFLSDVSQRRAADGNLELPGPGEGARALPRSNAHSWTTSLGRGKERAYLPRGEAAHIFFPALWGNLLFVSTGLELLAMDAFSGELRWRQNNDAAWDRIPERGGRDDVLRQDFFKAVERNNLMLAPAVGQGIAVVGLQVPVTQSRNQMFQGQLVIRNIHPDRRLYAYDAETGKELWNHHPPEDYDGERGGFVERMSVAGPPVIQGSRVLVPMYRLRGRVDYHAACFELSSGELLWSTNLISGQRELNMFGRHLMEFVAPPLKVEGDKVLCLTQLGTLAALDLYTGDVLWETLYDQIPLPRAQYMRTRTREQYWANAAPAVSGNVVIATPMDSRDMIAVDLDTGRALWSRYQHEISGRRQGLLTLIGLGPQTIYLGGNPLLFGQTTLPLSSGSAPLVPFASSSNYLNNDYPSPARAALSERFVVIPSHRFRTVFDRDSWNNGPEAAYSAPWREEEASGNLLLADGALYVCTGQNVHGFFEWEALERRLAERLIQAPDDVEVLDRYTALYFHRSRDLWREGQVRSALDGLRLAEDVLAGAGVESSLDNSLGSAEALGDLINPTNSFDSSAAGSLSASSNARLRERYQSILRGQAMLLHELANTPAALDCLRRAQNLSTDRRNLQLTLLQELHLLNERRGDRWLEVHATLDELCGDLALVANFQPFQKRLARGAVSAASPFRRSESTAGSPNVTGTTGWINSTGRWSLLERRAYFAGRRAYEREFELLHALLARYGNGSLSSVNLSSLTDENDSGASASQAGIGVAETISDRVAELLRFGETRAHAPFEERAQTRLAEILSTAEGDRLASGQDQPEGNTKAEKDSALRRDLDLRQLIALYPHSQASRQAASIRMAIAVTQGDVQMAADIVQTELEHDFRLDQAGNHQLDLLAQFSATLQKQNPLAGHGLMRNLARAHPQHFPQGLPFDDLSTGGSPQGQDFQSLAEVPAPNFQVPVPSESSNFDGQNAESGPFREGRYSFLAWAPVRASDDSPAGDGQTQDTIALFLRSDQPSLVAYSPTNWAQPLWELELLGSLSTHGEPKRLAMSGDTLVLASSDAVVGIDMQRGDFLWDWVLEEGSTIRIATTSGVALVKVLLPGRQPWLVARETGQGTELWRRPIPSHQDRDPIVGEGNVLMLSGSRKTATVLDAFTGRTRSLLELGENFPSHARESRAAWIEDDQLILPSFQHLRRDPRAQTPWIISIDLESGRKRWECSARDLLELDSIVQHGGRTYLVVVPVDTELRGRIIELNCRSGARRTVAGSDNLLSDDDVLGVTPKTRTELHDPMLFVQSTTPAGENVMIHAFELPYGLRWSQRLRLSWTDIYLDDWPAPAVSQQSVALAYSQQGNRNRGGQPRLVLFDRATGSIQDDLTLPLPMGSASHLHLATMGDVLLIGSEKNRLQIMRTR